MSTNHTPASATQKTPSAISATGKSRIKKDNKKPTAATIATSATTAASATAFLIELVRFYQEHGIAVERVLTDNGACFKRRWAEACAAHGIAAKKTRAYRPQTNGKAERFIRTLLERWAYAYPYQNESERLLALPPTLDFYNRFRPHRALRGLTPLQRVNNLPGTYS